MKFKFIAVFSVIILCFVNSFAQEREFELKVSLEDTSIVKNSDEVFATVKITNKSEKVLQTDGLYQVEFRFSKNYMGNEEGLIQNDYISRVSIPSKKLREDESLEFRVNLVKQNWSKSDSKNGERESDTSFKDISKENIYFYANIKLLAGYRNASNPKIVYKNGKAIQEPISKRPVYKKVNSNLIDVTLN